MSSVARILDANANRAREALRVMEDAARFALNDAAISRELKSLRHDLRAALDLLPPGWLEANRDTPNDVGTATTNPGETTRSGLVDVVSAADKRLTEALRVLEEFAKTLPIDEHRSIDDGTTAARIESIRYRAYAVASELQLRLGTGRSDQWRICLLLTETLCARPWLDVLNAAIDGGIDCVQVREKSLDAGALLERVQRVIEIARPAGVSVIVNDRVDIAIAAAADGVHLGTTDLPLLQARRIVGRSLLLGASTHDLAEAQAAVRAGADYCGIGAMFPSTLKPERPPAGTSYLQAFIAHYPDKPHLAIGGITPDNIHQLLEHGVRGVAVSSCVCAATDPARVTRQLREAIDAAITV